MKKIVLCRYCGRPEFYGEMRWLDGKQSCRACYRADYETKTGKLYRWDDLDGPVPTMDDYEGQEGGSFQNGNDQEEVTISS